MQGGGTSRKRNSDPSALNPRRGGRAQGATDSKEARAEPSSSVRGHFGWGQGRLGGLDHFPLTQEFLAAEGVRPGQGRLSVNETQSPLPRSRPWLLSFAQRATWRLRQRPFQARSTCHHKQINKQGGQGAPCLPAQSGECRGEQVNVVKCYRGQE